MAARIVPLPGGRSGENRHPVDELGDIREEVKRLEERGQELRQAILAGECTRVGERYAASVATTSTERLDAAAVKKHFGMERLRPFLISTEMQIVRVKSKA